MLRSRHVLVLAFALACHSKPAPQNAVQNEMLLLEDAMRDSVTAIARDNLASIPQSLHRVHEAREATEHALETGTYVLHRNASRREDFEKMDRAFHAELEKLEETANTNDSAKTATQLGAVLTQCNGCHADFR